MIGRANERVERQLVRVVGRQRRSFQVARGGEQQARVVRGMVTQAVLGPDRFGFKQPPAIWCGRTAKLHWNFPGYDRMVVCGYKRRRGRLDSISSLWAGYNRYLAHVIAHLPVSKLELFAG